jgi:stage III sporulation protein AG
MKKIQPMEQIKALWSRLGRLKYAAILALLGLILLFFPTESKQAEPTIEVTTETEESLATTLERALSEIDGAGKTTLVLSWSDDGEVVYQTDTRQTGADGSGTSEQTTATVQSGSSQQTGLVVQTRSPSCAGALVVCEGADSAEVRLRIVSAVAAVTGLGTDRITVVKMKS